MWNIEKCQTKRLTCSIAFCRFCSISASVLSERQKNTHTHTIKLFWAVKLALVIDPSSAYSMSYLDWLINKAWRWISSGSMCTGRRLAISSMDHLNFAGVWKTWIRVNSLWKQIVTVLQGCISKPEYCIMLHQYTMRILLVLVVVYTVWYTVLCIYWTKHLS